MRKGFWKGLRAIEIGIMLVFIIIAICLVYTRYDAFMCRSMESEAKFSLEQIFAAQMLYHQEHDRFAPFETLIKDEERVVLPQKYYTFRDELPPEQDKFWIRAYGKEGTLVAGQAWQIDATKALVNIQARCGQ